MEQHSAGAAPFAHVHAPKAVLYRAVMRVFVDAKRRFQVHQRPEDVHEVLEPAFERADVDAALTSLAEWGNLRADVDTSRVTSVADFYRPRYLYQLTREGEAAELALAAYDQALGAPGELQSIALEDIRVRLLNLLQQAQAPEPDPSISHGLLRELSNLLETLAANASAFMTSLQRTLQLQDADEDAFIAYKDRLIAYLERFVRDLVVKSAEIAGTLHQLDSASVERLLDAAAAREAVDVAPGAEAADAERARANKLDEWRGRWKGIRLWFVGGRAAPSQAALLRQRALSAIPELLAAVTVLQERRTGRSDRSADFRALAIWFAEMESDALAHQLWRAAFGLPSARHLTIDGDSIALVQDQSIPATTSWLDAPPLPISPRLRATGHYQRRGMLERVVDRSRERQLLEQLLAAERQQVLAARERLATGRPVRLSELGVLDRQSFDLFLALLGDALSAGPIGPGGITTLTSDGTLELTLVPTLDGARAQIQTAAGVLRGPDHVLTIVDRARPGASPREAISALQ